ncbi:MAG: hypothetical protein LDL07_12235, partial [Desulfarculus sp.]|nr:hypothetical protein [Desulfarculus sp.]
MAGVKPANAPNGGGLQLFRPAYQMVANARRLFTYYRLRRSGSPLDAAKSDKINANLPELSLAKPGRDFRLRNMELGLQSPGQKKTRPRLTGAANNNSRIIPALGWFYPRPFPAPFPALQRPGGGA